jgi:FkbH-like protein
VPGETSKQALLELVAGAEMPDVGLCAKISRASLESGEHEDAYQWLLRATRGSGPFLSWMTAAALLPKLEAVWQLPARRVVRAALASSYTTAQFASLLRLAALGRGIHLQLFEADFGAYAQSVLDPGSALYEFDPDYVILAPHEGAVGFPALSEDADGTLESEVAQWRELWDAVARHSRARVLQQGFVIRPETAWGHVSTRVRGSRDEMLRALNLRLAEAADDNVLMLDCDRIAGDFGKRRWFDDRYWHLAKQAVSLDALPDLARHTAAVLAAAEGLSAKAVVVDLDNTLWGGVIAEDGLEGIRLGDGPEGEAFVAFQEYLLALRSRGILLAVISKNDDRDARQPFMRHPDMRLSLSDVDVFIANWRDKATNVSQVAAELNVGLDALVFVDDDPAERQVIRQMRPQVEVIALPSDPAGYVRALSESIRFESVSVTDADLERSAHYRARAAASKLAPAASSLEEFYLGLEMAAVIAPFDELNLARIAQLTGKTNQFNVTTRRHTLADLRTFMDDDRFVTLCLRLRDRFGEHGLVAILIAEHDGDVLDIDTWLMSCRVIGRTVEDAMFCELWRLARQRGCRQIRGTFAPTDRNGLVRDLFPRLGFELDADLAGSVTWVYDVAGNEAPVNDYIETSGDARLVAA